MPPNNQPSTIQGTQDIGYGEPDANLVSNYAPSRQAIRSADLQPSALSGAVSSARSCLVISAGFFAILRPNIDTAGHDDLHAGIEAVLGSSVSAVVLASGEADESALCPTDGRPNTEP